MTSLFVTKEERIKAEDLRNLTKAAILVRIGDKIDLLCNEDIKNILKEKFDLLKRAKDSTKKEVFIQLCEEVECEMSQHSIMEDECHVEELSESEE